MFNATIVILRFVGDVQFFRAKLYGDFLECSAGSLEVGTYVMSERLTQGHLLRIWAKAE